MFNTPNDNIDKASLGEEFYKDVFEFDEIYDLNQFLNEDLVIKVFTEQINIILNVYRIINGGLIFIGSNPNTGVDHIRKRLSKKREICSFLFYNEVLNYFYVRDHTNASLQDRRDIPAAEVTQKNRSFLCYICTIAYSKFFCIYIR